MIYICEKRKRKERAFFLRRIFGLRKGFGGLFLEAEHALELEVREKKKDSKKGIFFKKTFSTLRREKEKGDSSTCSCLEVSPSLQNIYSFPDFFCLILLRFVGCFWFSHQRRIC